jgi:hypothetical protein
MQFSSLVSVHNLYVADHIDYSSHMQNLFSVKNCIWKYIIMLAK